MQADGKALEDFRQSRDRISFAFKDCSQVCEKCSVGDKGQKRNHVGGCGSIWVRENSDLVLGGSGRDKDNHRDEGLLQKQFRGLVDGSNVGNEREIRYLSNWVNTIH